MSDYSKNGVMADLKVKKRDGRLEEVFFDKITSRIKKLCYNLDMNILSPLSVTRKVKKKHNLFKKYSLTRNNCMREKNIILGH